MDKIFGWFFIVLKVVWLTFIGINVAVFCVSTFIDAVNYFMLFEYQPVLIETFLRDYFWSEYFAIRRHIIENMSAALWYDSVNPVLTSPISWVFGAFSLGLVSFHLLFRFGLRRFQLADPNAVL